MFKNYICILKILLLIIILWIGIIFEIKAQNQDFKRTNHWYFGNGCGLDFSSGHPVSDTSGKLNCNTNSSIISDTNGNLLFYTDGITVWSKNHLKMQNGDSIGVGQFADPRNRCIIVPQPENDSIYYIFTVDGWQHQYKNGLRYSIVNIKRQGGLGEVVVKAKQLFKPAAEMLAATKDATGCGYWIVSHSRQSDSFIVYNLNSYGFDTIPIISKAGSDFNWAQQYHANGGGRNLIFSPNGQFAANWVEYGWFAFHHGFDTLEIFKFNTINGVFNDLFKEALDTTQSGIVFSPNSKLLYQESGYNQIKIYQYNLTSLNALLISNSKQRVYTSPQYSIAQDFQIGVDGKIYSCVEGNLSGDSLSYILFPDSIGVGCDVHKGGIPLNGRIPTQGLPNFVSNFLANDASLNCTPTFIKPNIDSKALITIYPNPANDEFMLSSTEIINTIQLVDILGRTIQSKNVQTYQYNFKCLEIPEGVYLLEIMINLNRKIIKKIIIQHN